MPVQQVYFNIPPINEISTATNGDTLTGGYSVTKGKQKVTFQISAQDRLLDTSDMYLTFQAINVDANGTPLKIPVGSTRATYNANNGADLARLSNTNISNWSGFQNAIKRVDVQSLKSTTTIAESKNYPMIVGAKNAHTFSKVDYINTPLTRYMASGVDAGRVNRHSVCQSNATNASGGDFGNISNINDEHYGQHVSFKLDTGLLDNMTPLHLGAEFLGGLVIKLELNNDNGFYYERFQDIGTGQPNASATGTYYILKNMRLTGRFAVPTPDELKAYQPNMLIKDNNELNNTIQSSVNSAKYTPNNAMVRGIANLFLDQGVENEIKKNQSNFRLPLGLRTYQQNRQNVRNPQDFIIDVQPNLLDVNSSAPNNTVTYNASQVTQKASVQGDAEVRALFQRSLLGGRLADKTSVSLELTNDSLEDEYELTRASGGQANTQGVISNVNADCLGVGIDYTNAMGNFNNFMRVDYDLITRSGVASGNASLPESRRTLSENVITYIERNTSLNTQTLQTSAL